MQLRWKMHKQAESELNYDTDNICSIKKTDNYLFLNQNIYIKQQITTPEFETFELILLSINFKTVGLNSKFTPNMTLNNSGSVCVELESKFGSRNGGTMEFDSVLGNYSSALSSNQSRNSIFSFNPAHAIKEVPFQFQVIEKCKTTCNSTGTCISQAQNTLSFCLAPGNCTTNITPQTLDINQTYSILQWITTIGFESFYLISQNLTISTYGLTRKINISKTNLILGQTEIEFAIQFDYNDSLNIKVQSVLSDVPIETMDGTFTGALATQTIFLQSKIENISSKESQMKYVVRDIIHYFLIQLTLLFYNNNIQIVLLKNLRKYYSKFYVYNKILVQNAKRKFICNFMDHILWDKYVFKQMNSEYEQQI